MTYLSSIAASILFFIILSITGSYGYSDGDFSDEVITKILPQKSDLIVYLKSLHRIIEFCSKHKEDLDLNFEFGLFLVNGENLFSY